MGERAGYKISNIYQGGYNGMVPPANNYLQAGSLGMTTDPRTANVLQEVSSKLSMGVKNMEVTGITPDVFDAIPKQHLKEINRLSKLTGVDITLHGPLIEASGMSQQGYSDAEREMAEIKITNALLRSHELNPQGNIPVTFHSTVSIPGSQLLAPKDRKKNAEGEENNYKRIMAVNRETGRIAPIETEERFYPGGEKGEVRKVIHNPESSLDSQNHSEWDNTMSQIEFNRQRIDEITKDVDPVTAKVYLNWRAAQINPNIISKEALEELKDLNQDQWSQIQKMHAASTYADQAMKSANGAFSKAWENASTKEEKEHLSEISKRYGEILGSKEKGRINLDSFNPNVQSQALFTLINGLEKVPPKVWIPIEDFAVEKASQTYGNSAWAAYKKFGNTAPVLVIENPPVDSALATGQDIKDVVIASRKQFVQKAMKDGLSEDVAEKQAEKFIGATWDVGHINMLRKYGYTEKDIIKETETVAPYVKHVHLSDNFGMEHTELPMGMGNVPLKEMMEKLGKQGVDAKKVIEAGHWWNHFRTPPFQETLEAAGSPLYSMHMAPYWSSAPGLYQGYGGGLDGNWLPQTNYETFGTSFARLPAELGGQRPGAQGSRMSGRGME